MKRVYEGPTYRLVPLGDSAVRSQDAADMVPPEHSANISSKHDMQPSIPDSLALEWGLAGSFDTAANSASAGEEVCAICLEPLRKGSPAVVSLPICSHTFHLSCIGTMQLPESGKDGTVNAACAICRQPFDLNECRPDRQNSSRTSKSEDSSAKQDVDENEHGGGFCAQDWKNVGLEPPASISWLERGVADQGIAPNPVQTRKSRFSRHRFIREIFHACDKDSDARLKAAEVLNFAMHTGFDGTNKEWLEEYRLLCKERSCDPNDGLTCQMFIALLNDGSDTGCFCTDQQLQEICLKLHSLGSAVGWLNWK
jgi:hypothetical protein